MVTFLHTADWQIGMTRRWLQPADQARFDQDRLTAIRSAGRLARDRGCAFVVVAGDVFESNQLRQGTVLRALEAMGEMGVPVYLLPGNHDPLDAMSIYRHPTFLGACPDTVTVLESEGPYEVAPGVEIVAAPWRGKHPGRDLVADALARVGPADGTLRVLVGHGGVDVLDPSGRNPNAIATGPLFDAVQAGQIHYVALGDRHSRTDVGGRGCVWYSGTIEVTDPREEAPGDVLIVELSAEGGAQVLAHHIGAWDFRSLTRDLSSSDDVDQLLEELNSTPMKEKVVVKLALRGSVSVADFTRLHEGLGALGSTFGGLHHWDRHSDLVISPDDEQWSQLALSGYVSRAAEEIRLAMGDSMPVGSTERPDEELASAFSPDDADDSVSARDALALLYRLSGSGAR
ncbi:MAG: DNA repair exonuclease [Ornithinimicrobium sp.]